MINPKILDKNFAHVQNLGWPDNENVSKFNISWYRGNDYRDICFFSDLHLSDVDRVEAKTKVALLIEPPAIISGSYQYILQNHNKFDYILSFVRQLDKYIPKEKLLFYPMGGCWIKPEERKIYQKNRLLSIIASDKRWTDGHRLRHDVVNRYPDKMDLFGRGYKEVQSKREALENHYFSLCIMNSKIDDYFTDVVIDAFACGTIPIFWGTDNLKNYFDPNGFLTFNSLEELDSIMDSLTPELYFSKMDAIKNNLELVSKYDVSEDYMYQHYPFLFK